MARRKTLLRLLDDLRVEIRNSLNVAHNAQEHDHQVATLQRVQETLWEDFAWPHLRVERQLPVQAGQRFYAPPEDLDISRIERIDVFLDGCWRPLAPGVDGEHYTVWNSDLDQRAWPPRRWRIHEDEEIEVWPIADIDANAQTRDGYLKIVGIRNLKPLVGEADQADLDSRLIVLYAAGEILAARGSKDAAMKLGNAAKLYTRLRSGLTPRRRFQMFGIGERRSLRRLAPHYRAPG